MADEKIVNYNQYNDNNNNNLRANNNFPTR